MATDADGTVVRSVAGTAPGDRLTIRFADGRVDAVEHVHADSEEPT